MGDEKRHKDKNRSKLLKWHVDCAQRDESFHVEVLERRIRFFSILNLVILAAVIGGYLLADAWYEFALLLIGPWLVLGLNRELPSWDDFARSHELFVGARAKRNRIERALGLTDAASLSERANETDEMSERVVADSDRQYVLDLFRLHTLAAYALMAVLALTVVCRLFDQFFRVVQR